ncbi:MAG: nuclear transport factor 2 family protein [Acidimicrobiales bacterium]|jgi:ketosteroid isomerase-like protein
MSDEALLATWLDKLAIREVVERSMRCVDDQAGDSLAELFEADAVFQAAGTVFAGREAIRAMFGAAEPQPWTAPGELLKQPGAAHRGANPIIDVEGDSATAETDLLVIERDDAGRAKIKLVARYRDRLRRAQDGRWLITNRTGVSVARPGEVGTDTEWARAFEQMPPATRAAFRTE